MLPETASLHDNTRSLLEEVLGSALAYIRPQVDDKGERFFAVHAGDGTQLATFKSFDEAYFTSLQFSLEPCALH